MYSGLDEGRDMPVCNAVPAASLQQLQCISCTNGETAVTIKSHMLNCCNLFARFFCGNPYTQTASHAGKYSSICLRLHFIPWLAHVVTCNDAKRPMYVPTPSCTTLQGFGLTSRDVVCLRCPLCRSTISASCDYILFSPRRADPVHCADPSCEAHWGLWPTATVAAWHMGPWGLAPSSSAPTTTGGPMT